MNPIDKPVTSIVNTDNNINQIDKLIIKID